MTRKQKRIGFIGLGFIILGLATTLALTALSDTIVFFHSPSDVVEKQIEAGKRIRLGGLVKEGSVAHPDRGVVAFSVTDMEYTIPVTYRGVLPDLFREGQGVVTEGEMTPEGSFVADTVLAKHDENYMPPEVADALKDSGTWTGEGAQESHAEKFGQGSYP